MVNSGSFDSDGQGDRNAKVGCTQPHNASDSTQSSSPITASAATSCKTDFSQTADSDLPSVAHAIEPTPTKTEFNCDMPVENFTNLSSIDGAVEESENPPVSASENEKTSLCCSLPLDKVQGVLTPYHPSATKADDDGTKVKQPTRKLLCLYCDRSFVSANLRQKHVERIHSVKQNRRFSSRRQNQLTVTPCVYCDKINGTENTLKDLFQHLINEHSSKYFGCLPCEDRFLTSSLLADHNVSNHNSSTPQSSSNLEISTVANETTLKVPKVDDIKVEAEEEAPEDIPVKLTRSRMRPKPETENETAKKAIISNKKKSTKLKEMRSKKLSVKSSRIAMKRRESKRLQAIAKIADTQKKKRPKPGTEKKQSNISKTDQANSTKSTEKTKSNSTCINPYPEFDHFYRVKKITDHSIDNLKISSLTFDDVFDKAFFNRIKCNIEENLLHHIDGKLFKNEESESRISNFEKVSNVPQEIQNPNSENYGCELSLNAVTPVASLSLNSQFGEDFESQIEYGSKPSKKKTQTRKDEIHYKYFTRRKYQASILEHKENRDLSKLDMWTQLVIKKRQQKMLDDKKSAKEILEYTTCDEYKNKMQREELNRILDRRGPFEDLKEEASKKAALDKLNSVSDNSICQESFTEVREVLNEILNRVFAVTEDVTVEIEAAAEKTTCINKKPDLREIPGYLNLRRSSSLPSDGEIDKSDKIALICSSQETENFELPTNQVRGKDELIELTGEWARSRMYICAACGAKLPNMKYLLEHKSLYHQNVWVQHYEFVGNQSELYRHLSIPALGKVGAVEKSVQCKLWRRSDARLCTKCGKQCNALGELHRHILECGGDWTWMLARKKCKYRPFGAKSRRKRRGLVHRFHHKQKTEPAEKKTYKKTFDGPRQRPSDADTIQRMLANLPAKRSTRKLISLQDGIYRARKKSQINNINQNKIKCGKVIYKSSSRKETTEKTINTSISVTGKKQKNKPSSNRRSLRSLNKVLASRILDTNTKLSVKRKIKVLNEQRRTRRTQLLLEEIKETVIEENSTAVYVSPPPEKLKTKSTKKEYKEISEAEPVIKRSSPRASPKNVTKKMSVKKLLTGKINIKSFFPVKKRKNRKTLTENQNQLDTKSEVENTDVTTRSKRKSKEVPDKEEEKKEEVIIPKAENKKSKSETFSNLVRSLSIHKKKSTKTVVQGKTADASLNFTETKKQITISDNSKSSNENSLASVEDTKTQHETTNKKRKLKRSFRNVINRVKKLKIDNASEKTTQVKELPYNPKNHTNTFLEQSKPEEPVPPAHPEKIVIPSILEAKENTADISIPAPIVMDFHETNENPPIPETIFKLESNNEKSLQAKGELNFDTQPFSTSTNSEPLPVETQTALEYNEKTQPISIETSVKPKIVPLVSPNMKGKIRKPARGLNDCIAMLTSKLQQKIEEKPSTFTLLKPSTIKEVSPAKAECILRIPTFKTHITYSEIEETALDLSTKSLSRKDLSETRNDPSIDLTTKDVNSKTAETEEIEKVVNIRKLLGTDIEKVCNSVDKVIEEVVENKTQPIPQSKWNSIDEIIENVIENHHPLDSVLPNRNTIDAVIDFVIEYGHDKNINKTNESKAVVKSNNAVEKSVRKIGSGRKPKNKKSAVKLAELNENTGMTPKVVGAISKSQIENTTAVTVQVKETNEETANTKSNIKNSLKTAVEIVDSLKKKKGLKLEHGEIATETKPKKAVVEKTTKKTLDDDIENKSILEKINAYLNEAFIHTPDTAIVKNKKSIRKIGQVRNRSRPKKNIPTENKLSDKMLLETNLDTLLDVKEISANPNMSASLFSGDETTMTKDKEIKQLSNEDEPLLLENKVVTPQPTSNALPSDSEDDIPLAALVKPEESVKNSCGKDKTQQKIEDKEINETSLSKSDDAPPNLLSGNIIEINTHIDSCPVLVDTDVVSKKVTKKRSRSIKKKSADKLLTTDMVFSVGINVPDTIPSSAVESEESLEENALKGIKSNDNSNVTKKRTEPLKTASKPDAASIDDIGINKEKETIKNLVIPATNLSKKAQKRKIKSDKRKTELSEKFDVDDNVADNIDLDNQLTEISCTKETKLVGGNSEDSVNNLQDLEFIDRPFSDNQKTETNIEPKKSNEESPKSLTINGTNKADKTESLVQLTLENELSKKSLENIIEEIPNEIIVDVETAENIKYLAKNVLDSSEPVEIRKAPKKRGRPPKKKNFTSEINGTILQLNNSSRENFAVKSTNCLEQTGVQYETSEDSAKNILYSAESVDEIKKTSKKRSKSLKKKSINSASENHTLGSSTSTLLNENIVIDSTYEKVGTNFIEETLIQTKPKHDIAMNILDSAESVYEINTPGKVSVCSEKQNLLGESEETILIPSSLLTENIGIKCNNEESPKFIEQTDMPVDFVRNSLDCANFKAELKKPAKRRSRSLKKKNVNSKTDDPISEPSITSVNEDIGRSYEEVETNLIEPQPEFVEPLVKALKTTRKGSKAINRMNSRGESPIDSLLSDSSLNSSEVSDEFGETQPPVIITAAVVKKVSKRRSRSQKSQSPLENEEKSLSDISVSEVDASILDEKLVPQANYGTKDLLPLLQVKIARNREYRSLKKKSIIDVDRSSNLSSDTSLNSEVSDIFVTPVENVINEIEDILQVDESGTKKSKWSMDKNSETVMEVIGPNTELLNNTSIIQSNKITEQLEAGFIEPLIQTKKWRTRSVIKKPIIDCTDSEEENSDSFDGKMEESCPGDSPSNCTESNKTNKKSLKNKYLRGKSEQLTNTIEVDDLLKTNDLLKKIVEPEAKIKKSIKAKAKLKNMLTPGEVPGIESVSLNCSLVNDRTNRTEDVDNTPILSLDEIGKDNGIKNNIKSNVKQRRTTLKNPNKIKYKESKIISTRVHIEKQTTQSNALNESERDVADDIESEKVDEKPTENCKPHIQTVTEIPTITNKTSDTVESPNINCQEPPIKIIINKQKTRRKSKSFKKVDLKGQNDLFEDFALVIKKPKRIIPMITYTPLDTFSKELYPNYVKKPVEQPSPVTKSASEEVVEEVPPDLDATVEEMDMELDEIPITSNIIENLSFTATSPAGDLYSKADIEHPSQNLIPEKGSEIQGTKKRGRPAKNKALKDIQNEELFQPPERNLLLVTDAEEELLYEANRRSNRNKNIGDIVAFVLEADMPSRKPKPKARIKNSLDASFEQAEDINKFDFIPEKLKGNTEIHSPVPLTGKFVDKTVESVANIFDFISGISNKDTEIPSDLDEPPMSNRKSRKLKYNNKKEVQDDLEGDPIDFGELNDYVTKEIETVESSSNSSEVKPKRNKRKKSKSNLPEVELVTQPVNINSTLNILSQDPIFTKEKDIDSIYAFTEFDDLEIDLPIEKPRRQARKQTKSFSETIDNLKNKVNDSICETGVVPFVDLPKDLKPDTDENSEEIVSKPLTKRKSKSGRDTFNTNPENEESKSTGEIKENNISDIPENGRRKSIRSAKVKALEHIHDDALAELTESERNRDLDKDKVIPPEENSPISDELTKKKSNKRQSKTQNAPKLLEDQDLPKEIEEFTLLAELANGSEKLKKNVEKELSEGVIISTSGDETKKSASKTPSKAQKIHLLEDLDQLPDDIKESQLLADLAQDLTGLEELENSIERELNTAQMEIKKKAKPAKSKLFKQSEDSEVTLNEPNMEAALKNELLIEENNQELRRSRRGSRKIASYNENDLVDPLLDEIDGKRKNRRKEKSEEVEGIPVVESKIVKKTKEPAKKLNSDELFDLLKASSKENIYIPKAPNSFLSNLEESSRDFNDDNFENVFENILEKSTFLIHNAIVDKNKEDKDVDKIYEFTESPESDDQMQDDILLSECKRKIHKKLPRQNVSPSRPQVEDNSDSVLNGSISETVSIPTTPDLHDSSVDSKTRSAKTHKMQTLDKTNYCEICNKSFIRIENLTKHKRTLTHIQKLSEIEAKEAAKKSKVDQAQNESSKTSDSIIEITSESSKVMSDLSKTNINISDILQESNKPSEIQSPIVHSSFANNHSLKLADIINDVLNKPVLEGDNEKHSSFSDIIMQNNTDVQPEYRRYKSLGERKSFDSEPIEPQQIPIPEPYVSKTTILEKQISLLENIIENQSGVNYIDDISMSSNNSLENNVLENNSARGSVSELSLKQDDSSNITYTKNNVLKPSTDDSFLKPSQYEEISEDSINLRNYDDQKLRKTLNRDEELFLECCSLLKSGSEVSSYSNKKSHNKVLSSMGLKQCDEPEWLERKSLVQKPLYEVAHDYSDDNSRIPTPLGDSYDDDASNSNTISSNWNMNKKVSIFEDISQEKTDSANKSFTFEEVLNEYEECDKKNKSSISKFGGILSKTISDQINTVHKIIRKPFVTENFKEKVSEKKLEDLSDGFTSDNKKVITKGARKVFEGLRVSIPTEELNLEEVLNCSPKSKKMEIVNIQNFVENAKLSEEAPSSQCKPSRTARKSKPVKNKSQFGSNLLFKMNKKKVVSPTNTKQKDDELKSHDIYDFEETQDNTDVFTKPDFRTFRSMKSNETALEPESDTESTDYLDSFSAEGQSITSSVSSTSSKKAKTQENITKKKCMIMGRIFKNAAKSKIEDIDEEIRDIPVIDNSQLIESYVANCKKVIKNEEVAKPKLSENEINQLFDQLLENKLDNLDMAHSDIKTTVKSKPDLKRTDVKKKLKTKNRKRPRTNSESTDDEFSLNKTTKKRSYRKNAKAEDNCINLEQELKECIGVASRKSQRKCTSGKQNVLVEYWSSDDSQFEALLESQRIESRQSTQVVDEEKDLVPQALKDMPVEDRITEPPKSSTSETSEKPHKPKNTDKKPQQKRKLSSERKPKSVGAGNGKNMDTVTSNRRKRAAANPLYHWSSSSEDESQDLIEVKPIRDELEDDEDRPVQHGWIVGDSPKKLVTMLAQAKGKKTDIDCVKEQGKKRTNAVS